MFRSSGSSAHVLPFFWHAIFPAAFLLAAMVAPASAQEKPKVRTITAFIRLDPAQYQQQITDTLTMLRNAKSRFGLAGYEVQTIRITTQPFPNTRTACPRMRHWRSFTISMPSPNRRDVSISIGPALMDETDDPAQAELLEDILGESTNLYGSVVVAGRDGVHWKRRSRGGGNYKISRGSSRGRPR